MALGIGAKSWISFIENGSTYGADNTMAVFTAGGARAGYARIVSDGMESNENTFQSPALGSRTVSSMYQGAREVGGPVEFEVGYDGVILWLLKHAMGGYALTINSGAVTGYMKHAFSLKDDLPVGGLSLEECMAGIPTSAKVMRYTSVKVNKLELALEQGGVLKCTADLIALDENTNGGTGWTPVDATYPVFGTFRPVKFFHQTGPTDSQQIKVAGSTLSGATGSIRNWKLTIDNKLERRFNLSRFTAEPMPNDKRDVLFECTGEFTDLSLYDKYQNATEGAFRVRVSSKDEGVFAVLSSPFLIDIQGNTQRMTGSRPKVNNAGIVTVDYASQLIGSAGEFSSFDIYNAQNTTGLLAAA